MCYLQDIVLSAISQNNSQPIASNNICISQGMEPLVISYTINQPVDPQLWDGNFSPTSLFRINEYLEENTKNITYLLLRIVTFIRQCKL